jgi:TolB protein
MKRVEGSTVTQLTADPANDTMPAISPDGKSVAFCSNRNGSWDIYIQPIEGGQPTQLTNSPSHELHPSWSPNGRQIIFSALGEQSGQWEMVLVDAANPSSRKFVGYGLFPEFSPDGSKVVFQRARYRGTRWFSIWTMDIDNGEAKRPTQIAASTNAAVITPTWSPDGRRIAFATVVNPRKDDPNKRPANADLWVINVDGTGRVKLTSDKFVNLQPTWGRDGWVYFISNRIGADNIWAVRPSQPTIAGGASEAPGAAEAAVPIDQPN